MKKRGLVRVSFDVQKSDGSIVNRSTEVGIDMPISIGVEEGNVREAVIRVAKKSRSGAEEYVSLDVKIEYPEREIKIMSYYMYSWFNQVKEEESEKIKRSSWLAFFWKKDEYKEELNYELYIKGTLFVVLGKVYITMKGECGVLYEGHFYENGQAYNCGINSDIEALKKIVERKIFSGHTGDEFLNVLHSGK